VSLHEHDTGEAILARLQCRDRRFADWLATLRRDDPKFAEASVLAADSWGEWQAAVYLLTGSFEAWQHFGADILAEGSIAPVIRELQDPQRGWSSGEHTLLIWAAHFWNVGASQVSFPDRLDEPRFRRWTNAAHLYQRVAPEPETIAGGGS
jgi:hypothetical protein